MIEYTELDRACMREAIELARLGQGLVEPNPMVGCILTHEGRKVGVGYHQKFGGPHAERNALANVAGNVPYGCTAYVSLEPCGHHGKTPPCTEALIQARVARVVVSMRDPCELVAGKGMAQLQAAGIQVDCGLEEPASRRLNAPYIKRILTHRPWVIGKWAMTLDGKIASKTGHSQWITSTASRAQVHAMRGRVDAIIVGRGTVMLDDPLLTARPPGLRRAMRVVLDSRLTISDSSQLVKTAREFPLLIWTGPEVPMGRAEHLRGLGCQVHVCPFADRQERLLLLLEHLSREYSATNVLVEGGQDLLGSLFDLHQVDQCEIYLAPKLLGGHDAPSPIGGLGLDRVSDDPQLLVESVETLDSDLHVSCLVRNTSFPEQSSQRSG